MLYLGTTPLAGMIKTNLFTSSGTFVIPADVSCIWIDGCGGGSGGGGGDPTPGGGGGGGGCGQACRGLCFAVTPSDTLSMIIAAGGAAGAAGQDGGTGGYTELSSSATGLIVSLSGPDPGKKGTPSAGGLAGGTVPYGSSINSYYTSTTNSLPLYMPIEFINNSSVSYFPGSEGGALNTAGSPRFGGSIAGGIYNAGAIGGALGGGGGHGATGPYGVFTNTSGQGGGNGAAGNDALGFGCGGGGGSGDSAGGAGSPGFIRIYYISKYTIA